MANMSEYLKRKIEDRSIAFDEFCTEWFIRHPDMKIPPIIFEDDIIVEEPLI